MGLTSGWSSRNRERSTRRVEGEGVASEVGEKRKGKGEVTGGAQGQVCQKSYR